MLFPFQIFPLFSKKNTVIVIRHCINRKSYVFLCDIFC